MGPVTITLDLYALLYFIDAFRLPFQTEIDVVVALTQGYLEDFFTVVFESSSLAAFEGSTTVEDEKPISSKAVPVKANATTAEQPPVIFSIYTI